MTHFRNCWEKVSYALKNARVLYLHGLPGTGKTHAAMFDELEGREEVIVADCDQASENSVYTVTMTEDGSTAELEGFFRPNEKGGMDWLDGKLTRAVAQGARLILNEVTHASPEQHTYLHPICESFDTARLVLPNGNILTPGKNFQVIMTDNLPPEELPSALRDRIEVSIHIDEIAEAALQTFPSEWHNIIRSTVLIEDRERMSLRSWKAIQRFAETSIGFQGALELVIGEERATQISDAILVASTSER